MSLNGTGYFSSSPPLFQIKSLLNVLLSAAITVFGVSGVAHAAPDDISDIPVDLQNWIPWVVSQHPEWNCARVPAAERGQGRICSWIGSARFTIRDHQTEFLVQGELLKDDRIQLPFSAAMRPSDLKVVRDGAQTERYIIEEQGGELSLKLQRGSYAISGVLEYATLPERIPVPQLYGIVDILQQFSREGAVRAYRDNSSIRIVSQVEGNSHDSVEGRIWRAAADGNPIQIRTRMILQVSGKPRTLQLGKVLPQGAILVSSESSAPIAFSESGELSVQVFQGQHTLELVSMLAQPADKIQLPETSAEVFSDEEIWTWDANTGLRTVEIEDARMLNAAQVDLPPGWSAQTVLGVSRGGALVLKELRRGQEVAPRNEISIERMIWPKLEGGGFAVEDRFQGVVNDGFRLNALPELHLGSATVAGAPVPVTVDPRNKALGVELRTQQLSLKAVSELPASQIFSADISSAGWEGNFEAVSLNLSIPPSWKAIHLSNVTSQFGTWSSLWSIFDLFLLLVLTVFSIRIFGARVGYVFLAFALFGKGEFMMPAVFYGWTLFFAACSLPLTERSYPALRIACAAGLGSSMVAFLVQGLIFSKLQLIQAIHPQLQSGTRYRTITQELLSMFSESPYLWPAMVYGIIIAVLLLFWVRRGKYLIEKFGRLVVAGIAFFFLCSIAAGFLSMLGDFSPVSYQQYTGPQSMPYESQMAAGDSAGYSDTLEKSIGRMSSPGRVAPKIRRKVENAPGSDRLLQSGPSLPQWRWRTVLATVAGPVSADHRITIYMVPEAFERVACLIRLLLTLMLAYALVIAILRSFRGSFSGFSKPPAAVTAALLALCLLPFQQAQAEIPPSELLEQLSRRLEREQCSAVNCTSIDTVSLNVEGSSFLIEMKVRSLGVGAVTVPGPVSELIPQRVTIDGKESIAARLAGKHLQVKVSDGAHLVSVSGRIESGASFAVSIPEKPLQFSHRLSGWELVAPLVQGVVPDELRLVRPTDARGQSDSPESRKGAVHTRSIYHLQRMLVIDERISVEGEVSRIGNTDKAGTVRIPLHQGENVSSSSWPVEDGALAVTFAPGESSIRFSSLIAAAGEVVLKAVDDETLFEQWSVRCKDYVQCETSGISPIYRAAQGEASLLFLPYRNESVTIKSLMLESAKGNFVTVDSVTHSNTWGETTLKGQIDMSVRATRQAPLVLAFEEQGLVIDQATINGVPDTRRFSPQQVSLLLEPGTHAVSVQYSRPFSPGVHEQVPVVRLNYPAGNITTVVAPSPSRWIIWLGGSSWGPAVVFWSKLLVALILLVLLKLFAGFAISWFAVVVLALGVSFLPTVLQPVPVLWVALLSSQRTRELLDSYLGSRQKQILLSLLAAASLVLFYSIIRVGLLQDPPSLITGNGSNGSALRWYNDFVLAQEGSVLPTAWVLSLPLRWWRAITLLLSVALVFLGLAWTRSTVRLVKEEQ